MTFLGTTALALSLLAEAPESAPVQPKPQTRVEAVKKSESPLPGLLMIGIAYRGAQFRIAGDREKQIPFRLSIPIGNFLELQYREFNDRDFSDLFRGF